MRGIRWRSFWMATWESERDAWVRIDIKLPLFARCHVSKFRGPPLVADRLVEILTSAHASIATFARPISPQTSRPRATSAALSRHGPEPLVMGLGGSGGDFLVVHLVGVALVVLVASCRIAASRRTRPRAFVVTFVV